MRFPASAFPTAVDEVFTVANTSLAAGEVVSFGGTFTDPGSCDTHIIQWDLGDGKIADSTFYDNTATTGGGIDNYSGTTDIKNTTMAGNTGRNCAGTITSRFARHDTLNLEQKQREKGSALQVCWPVSVCTQSRIVVYLVR